MIREMLALGLERLGLATRLLSYRHKTRTPWLTVLSYHRVLPSGLSDPFDQDVVTASAAFDRQLSLITSAFDVVSMDDVVRALRGGALPPSPLLITFDDGYRDNHDVVLPLLVKHGARATFFVATSYVDERRIFWWDRISYIFRKSRSDSVNLTYPYPIVLSLRPNPDKAITAALRVIKEHRDLDLPRFLEHLEQAAAVDLSRNVERRLADRHIMTWEQVRALRRAGMDVQSHTCTHRVLETLSGSELRDELRASRSRLQEVLDEPVETISYPVGRRTGDVREVREAVREAGYSAAFSNHGGVNPRNRVDAMNIRRISIENTCDNGRARSVLAVPALAD